jgi:hypothetical protein
MSALFDSPEPTPAPSRLPSKAGRRGSMSGAVSKGDTSKGGKSPWRGVKAGGPAQEQDQFKRGCGGR